VYDAVNKQLILEKELEVLDESTATRGLALLTLNESDTMDLINSSYSFSVKLEDTDGTYLPTYSNTYYGVAGTLHLMQDVYPVLQDSTEISTFNITYNDTIQKYEHKSGNIYAQPEYNGNTALHTMALYMTGYRGTVYIQGTLDNSPESSENYSTIQQLTYTGFSGIDYINFNGVYTYVRIIHIPDTAPAESINDNSNFFGSFDKVLYRS
jgi:hypothetical protein